MPIIGLNLGKSSFRAVELEKKRDGIVLNKFALYEKPGLNLLSESADDQKKYIAALEHFVTEMGFTTADTVVGIDEANVFMRVIKMPVMNDKELKTSIKIEAEQYIPVPINDVNLSFQKLDIDFADKNKMDVQIVAAKKDILEKYVRILRSAHLLPRAIEPETLALGRLFGDTKEQPMGTVILEMGLTSTLIIVVYAGAVRFSRTVPVGGEILTKTIQQALNLDPMQAEEYKKIYGMDPSQAEGKIYNAIKPLIDSIIQEVSRASVFFTNHNPSASIRRIILTGGTALMPGLLLYIASNLEYEVELANPIKNITLNPKIEPSRHIIVDQGPLYSLAVGLALRGL